MFVSGCDILPIIANAVIANITTPGYDVCYECTNGFVNVGGDIFCSACMPDGTWTAVTLLCKLQKKCFSYKKRFIHSVWFHSANLSQGNKLC